MKTQTGLERFVEWVYKEIIDCYPAPDANTGKEGR
jgi:hypothetical protein